MELRVRNDVTLPRHSENSKNNMPSSGEIHLYSPMRDEREHTKDPTLEPNASCLTVLYRAINRWRKIGQNTSRLERSPYQGNIQASLETVRKQASRAREASESTHGEGIQSATNHSALLPIEYFRTRERTTTEGTKYAEAELYEGEIPTELHLHDGQVALFGYGSLLSKTSMEKTLGQSYEERCIPCKIPGWRRTFDVAMPNPSEIGFAGKWKENQKLMQAGIHEESEFIPEKITYCNVRQSTRDAVNGMLYVVTNEQLKGFDKREWPYNRVDITEPLREQGVNVIDGHAYMYVGKEDFVIKDLSTVPLEEVGLRQSYLDMIKDGLDQLGNKFVQDFIKTTDNVPSNLLFYDYKRGTGGSSLTQKEIDKFRRKSVQILSCK
jgi:hypothetical protein